jgi:hypothetical protein
MGGKAPNFYTLGSRDDGTFSPSSPFALCLNVLKGINAPKTRDCLWTCGPYSTRIWMPWQKRLIGAGLNTGSGLSGVLPRNGRSASGASLSLLTFRKSCIGSSPVESWKRNGCNHGGMQSSLPPMFTPQCALCYYYA